MSDATPDQSLEGRKKLNLGFKPRQLLECYFVRDNELFINSFFLFHVMRVHIGESSYSSVAPINSFSLSVCVCCKLYRGWIECIRGSPGNPGRLTPDRREHTSTHLNRPTKRMNALQTSVFRAEPGVRGGARG